MLTKFESKSNRVKGLSFHPVRPWILASLHNGQIQLWDYRMGTCLDKFEEHDGPVRGVDFHRSQSLIVSGGDDYKVKVWDYKLRRCLFTLLGHLDYIRTVQFHVDYPWIVSASDDQTIRIWNWQSRNCISVLTGHNHYVMCAAFHPKEDMIVSASLDQTVRVWDTTGLRKKTVRGAPPQIDEANVVSRVNNELFGGNDAVVKYVLEGHERGVNWAAFHPTLPLIISGADDRQVKLWRMNETKAWEVDTMRGHTNNVSCVLFHPKHELIVSNSEDRTIRVWDISKRLGVQTFRRENDRFWILSAHPDQNILAAGHDSGMIVFKLERERPAFDTLPNRCFYIKDRYLRLHEFNSSKDLPLVSLRRASTNTTPGIGGGPRSLNYNALNKSENNVLIQSDVDGGSYELITFSTDSTGSGDAQDVKRGTGIASVFIARDRFVVLDKSKQLLVKNFQNEVVKRYTPMLSGIDSVFFSGTSGRAVLKSDDRVVLYDFQARKNISELQMNRVKYVVWNQDYSLVALLSKHQIVLANKQLEHLFTLNETVRVKGGCWDLSKNIFIYATSNHIKYALPFGDKGIIRTLDSPVYLVRASGNTVHCLDREAKVKIFEIDITEALFKIALHSNSYGEVMHLVKHSRLCGQSIVSYLQEKGYPEVALHFVHDNKTRFKLALACGNIQVAMNVAHELDDDAWLQLGIEALRQGNFEVVEMSYQKTKDFERLSFLYLLTGSLDKLKKMMKIAEMRNDAMSVLHNSLYLGDIEERVKILELAGQLSISYTLAKTYGVEEAVERISKLLSNKASVEKFLKERSHLIIPPTPILRGSNWPYLTVSGGFDKGKISVVGSSVKYQIDDDREPTEPANWGDDDDIFEDAVDEKKVTAKTSSNDVTEGAGWKDDDLELSDDDGPSSKVFVDEKTAETSVNVPPAGISPSLAWSAESSHCADHFASGAVETAVQLLHRQIAASRLSSIKSAASGVFSSAHAYLPGLFSTPSTRHYLSRDNSKLSSLPKLPYSILFLLDSLKSAYRAFTAAQLDECKAVLDTVISIIPLVAVASKSESDDLKEILSICREYLISVRIKSTLDKADDISRSLELAAYFTHCGLQPPHLLLALKTAMATAFKNKNFANAASFAHRLLDLPELSSEKNAELKAKAQKVVQKSEMQGRNEYNIDYDERNPFLIDCDQLKPIYKGNPSLNCPYCGATYNPGYQGKICQICSLCTVGITSVGLVTQSTSRNRK